ncbi:MAG TPA: CRTAC1 family protein [Rhodothermales bacterium]
MGRSLSFRQWIANGAAPVILAACITLPAEDQSRAWFEDVTQTAGLGDFRHENGAFGSAWEPEIIGAGAAFIDYDGDDWQDLLLVGGGGFLEGEPRDVPALWLYRNDGDGTFRLVNEEVGLADVRAYGIGLAVGDYDNDGDDDFLLTTLYENLVFRNDLAPDGRGRRFTEVGKATGLAGPRDWSSSAIFFDADRDGWLDVYVGNYLEWSPEIDRDCVRNGKLGYCTPEESKGKGSRFYRNNGDGTFTDRTVESGIAAGIEPGRNKVLGVTEHDFNDDGWPDLFVGVDTERDLLYVNRGDGTFDERGISLAVAYSPEGKARAGMGVDAGVVDETGKTTLFVGNFSRESVGVYRLTDLGYFETRDVASRLARASNATLTFGLFLFDVDLDGDLDLFLANGHVQIYIEESVPGTFFRQPPQLFLNDGHGVFSPAGEGEPPFTDRLVGRGAAYADYDRDGDLDVIICENGGPVRLWRNLSQNASWVRLRFHGTPPDNRNAYGSVVRGYVNGREMTRRVHDGSSFASHSETVVTFGLGDAEALDSVVIRWPSGALQRLGRIARGQEVDVYRSGAQVAAR